MSSNKKIRSKKIKNNKKIYKTNKTSKTNKTNRTNKKIYKKKYSNQKGGKKLGSGKYGCVVKPYVKCYETDDYNPKKHVSKLFLKKMTTSDLASELSIYKKIHNIDKDNKFFITYKNICELQNKFIKDRKDILLKNKSKNKNNLFSSNENRENMEKCVIDMSINPLNMIMEDGGYELVDLIDIKKDKYLLFRQHTKEYLKRYFHKLLIGIKKLHNINIVHKDIKPKNILFKPEYNIQRNKNNKNNRYDKNNENDKDDLEIKDIKDIKYLNIRYIDFGLSDNLDYIKSIGDISVAGSKGYRPPELVSFRIIINTVNSKKFDKNNRNHILKLKNNVINKLKEELIEKFKKKKITNKSFNDKLNEDNIFYKDCIYDEKDINELINLIYRNNKNNTLFDKFIQKNKGYLFKVDVFSLGVVFYTVAKSLDIEDKKLFNLIKNMIKFNPEKRYTVNECLNDTYFKN